MNLLKKLFIFLFLGFLLSVSNKLFAQGEANIIPDYQNKTLIIKLHSLSTPRAIEAVKKLCQLLNGTETKYLCSELRMIYKTVAA